MIISRAIVALGAGPMNLLAYYTCLEFQRKHRVKQKVR
jgi:hypothetical protein